MSSNKLTDAEARQLLEMTKKSLVQEINFPTRGNEKEFDVVGDTKKDVSIFSEIDVSFFTRNNTAQDRFLALFLQYLKNCLLKIYTQYGVIRVLPKLSITLDEDEAIVLNWAYANFRIYFTFEKVIENSYYGIVAQDTEETVFTNVGKLTEIKYSSIIDMILTYVIDNS